MLCLYHNLLQGLRHQELQSQGKLKGRLDNSDINESFQFLVMFVFCNFAFKHDSRSFHASASIMIHLMCVDVLSYISLLLKCL